MSTRARHRRVVHIARWACLIAASVVAVHLVLVLSQGGYSFTVVGLTVSSRRLTSGAMLLVALIAGAVMLSKGQLSRDILLSHSGTLLFVALFVLYLANGKTLWSGDTLPLRYLPISLLREGNFDLDEFPFLYLPGGSRAFGLVTKGGLEMPYYVERAGDHYVSLYPVAVAVLVTPLYLPSVLGGLHPDDAIFETLEKVSAAAIVAVSAVILYFTLRRVTSATMAFAITLIYGLGTSSLSVSSQALWQHGPSQLALSAALYGTVRCMAQGTWLGFTGFWLAFAVICRPTDILVAVPLAAYVISHQPRHAYLLGLGGVAPIVFQLSYNYAYFGDPLHSSLGMGAAFWSTPIWQGLSGILLSPGRGLFVYSPIYLFSVWALALSWRRQGDAILRSLSVGVVVAILLYSKWVMWWGGYSYGPRLLADLAPVLGFSLYPAREWIARSRVAKTLFLFAALCSMYAHVVGAFVDDGTWNSRMDIDRFPERVWMWTDNPLTNASIRLLSRVGHVVGGAQ
jgi:hypothetical protein